MRELKFRAWIGKGINYDRKIIKKGMHLVTGLHFFEGLEFTSISIDTEDYGEIQDIWFEDKPIEIMQYTGLKDRGGVEIYEGDIIQFNTGLGYIKYTADDYTLGFEVELIAGGSFYDYDMEHPAWDRIKVIGNIYEDDLIEKYKYGITPSFNPVSRESAKKKFVTVVKRGWHYRGDYVPTQAIIPQEIGIRMRDVVGELRDELVKEGKLIQDPDRYWMCKIPENPELLTQKEKKGE